VKRLEIPSGLGRWRDEPGGTEWLERLPRLVDECAEVWSLEVAQPFQGSHISLVLPATCADGTPAVLKLNFPEPESEHEADALEHWAGEGAVRLLAHDPTGGRCSSSVASPGLSSGASPTRTARIRSRPAS